MDRYESYKDSGVEWIGRIPTNWTTVAMRYLLVKRITDGPHETPNFVEEGIPFLSVDGIQDGELVFENCRKISIEDHEQYKKKCIVEKDDILMGKAASVGKVARVKVDFEFSIWSPLALLKPDQKKITPQYFEYFLKSNYAKDNANILSTFNTQQNISMTDIPRIYFALPSSLKEQNKVSDFLDHKTALIDDLIEKTKRKIELLKEKRTALINEVVTKGLDPNVPMKDSGVEWIGEIPVHWKVVKLKHISQENCRSLSNSTDPNYSLKYIEISDVNSDGVIGEPTKYVFSESPSRCRRIVQIGDVIVSTVRTYLKAIGIISHEVEDLICSTGFSVITPNDDINPKYLFYLLRSEWFISKVISKSEGVSYPSIQSEKLMNTEVLFCPSEEQRNISEYLDNQSGMINNTITIEEKRIETLKEYRQALISEVVTGKIKVCD